MTALFLNNIIIVKLRVGLVFIPSLTKEVCFMKKIITFVALVAMVVAMSGCSSLRTPSNGPRAGKVYYSTFMGLSIESAVYGDGFVVDTK